MNQRDARTVTLDDALYRTDLPNGLVVVTERIASVRSAAVGIWVRTASGHERRDKMGASHLLEHLVFKGTARRTAREIAVSLESRGGSLDAFTSRDHTAFQAHVLDSDLDLSLDVLTDLVRRPLLRDADLDLERQVVLEELHGVVDTPDDLIGELWNETLWPDHPYGYSILGTEDTVRAMQGDDLRRVHDAGYYPGNCVIAVAGNVTHDAVLRGLEREGWFDGAFREPRSGVVAHPGVRGAERSEARDLQQSHVMLGTDTIDAADPRRWGLALLTAVLGGGMSSRLFQRVREELGLCYAIHAWHACYRAAGLFAVYVGTQPDKVAEAVAEIRNELARVMRDGLPEEELRDAKAQLMGNVTLALESTVSRMNRLAVHVLHDEPYRSIDDVRRMIDGVTGAEICELAREFLDPARMTTVTLGPS